MKKKTLVLVLALALVLICAIGVTLAWLTAKTDEVKNTFTSSDIDITLEETTGEEYKMLPGYTIEKDPTVTVKAGSEECYLFVKVEKSANFDDYMTYEMADGWTKLPDVDNVYYRVVEATEADVAYSVLKNNTVTVKDTVTKADMEELSEGNYPTLTVTAYASQYNKSANAAFTAAEAWANIG